ncbi:ATP-binding protein [Campylobacter portucalensis]|nr:HAMP domain-containing sensor histidine kinase [Campylobacter portucalensis]
MLILIFSVMLYHYIKINIYENVVKVLNLEVEKILNLNSLNDKVYEFYNENLGHNSVEVSINDNKINLSKPKYTKIYKDDKNFLKLDYPAKDKIISLQTDTTFYANIVSQTLTNIIVINSTMIFLILFYALFLSRTLLIPIKTLTNRLSKLNETVLIHIDENTIPQEFKPLAKGINRLIDRIYTFIQYQKELFIGIAHELKTPLAVMKTKNEVTLLKKRDVEKYIEALQNNNNSINAMNKMISSILEIGRQENAQFEKGVEKDIIAYLDEISNNFKILARNEGKDVDARLSPSEFFMTIQPTLLLHILQNFIQNAIKFSPKGSVILIKSRLYDGFFEISVIDEGCGIDESLDLFAPFKRYGDKSGAGLGLFLAKGAAQAMNAKIYLKNRNDKKGSVASIKIPTSHKTKGF